MPTTGASRLFAAFTALIGVSLVALFTANIVAFFVGGEETQLRRDLQRDVQELQQKIAAARKNGRKNIILRVEREGNTRFIALPFEAG